jgi:phosphatidate cytidylyltransferase
MTNKSDIYPFKLIGYIIGTLTYVLLVLSALEFIPIILLTFIPLMIFLFFTVELFRQKEKTAENVALGILPILYITIPFSFLVFLMSPKLTNSQPHWHLILSYFVILWSHDTFAYLTGSLTGKHKLYLRLSPNKTWEGSVGGTIFALIAAYILSIFFPELNTLQWLSGAFIIAVFGTLGDLSESLLKRRFDIKDSGNFFPGHGGVLDRFDSILFSAPALFAYILLLKL